MSDIKRVALTTLEPQKVTDGPAKKPCRTVRIAVVLPESNEDNCPEYNYKDELAAAKKKSKHKDNKEVNSVGNGLDPFGEDDDDVRRIAMQMEEKYGTGTSGNKKKKKGRKDDYADIGMGYDESDSFIDNTDGYDEIIPQRVTTLHGGFYINSGALEFKTDDEATSEFSSSSSESESESNAKNKRKRILDTSDEEGDKNDKEAKKVKTNPKNSMQQAIKKKMFNTNKIQVKKRKLVDPAKKTMTELLREKREDLNMSLPAELKNDVVEDGAEKDALKENKKPMSITSVTDAIESVIKGTLDKPTNSSIEVGKNTADLHPKEGHVRKSDAPSSLEGESSHETSIEKMEIVKLPENLPGDIVEVINSIKKAAFDNKDGKVKFFNDEVNAMLLNLERKCKCLGKSSRSKIYDHLSPFVKCRKETLIRRAKLLVIEDEERKLKKCISKLKTGIDEIMPSLLINHEKESQKIMEKKFSQEGIDNEDTKSLRMPKRQFQWCEDTRKLLKEIVSIKRKCFLLEGKPKENLEPLILDYLKQSIQPLWPDGWMSLTALKRSVSIDVPKVPENSKPQVFSETKHSKPTNPVNFANQNSNNLQIIPIKNNVVKTSPPKPEISNDFTVSKIVTSDKAKLPESLSHNLTISPAISVTATFKDSDIKPKVFDINRGVDLLKVKKPEGGKVGDSGVIVSSKVREDYPKIYVRGESEMKESNSVIPDKNHCQIIDLTESISSKQEGRKEKEARPLQLTKEPVNSYVRSGQYNSNKETAAIEFLKSTSPYTEALKISMHPELSVTPNFGKSGLDLTSSKNTTDDFQKVMEDLKVLNQLSSPSKSSKNSMGSPVSVIAFNKNASSKTSSHQPPHSSHQRIDLKNHEFTPGFQEDFQKQFMNTLSHMSSPTSSKNNFNRCN